MNNNHQLLNIGKKLYLYSFGIGMFLIIFSTSKFKVTNNLTDNASVISLFIAIILFFISIFYTNYFTYSEIVFIIVVLTIGTVTSFISKGSEPFMMSLYMISSRKINPYDVLKVVFIVNVALFLSNYILFRAGILLDYQNFSINKHSFGYNHPNQMGISIFSLISISMVFLYTKRTSKSLINYLILFLQVPLLVLVFLSGSRGAEIATIITYIIFCILILTHESKKNLLIISVSVLVICLLFSLYTVGNSVNTVGSFLYTLNQLFTQRLQLNNYFYNNYGVSLFGQRVTYNLNASLSSNYAIIDNAYIKLIINYGISYTIFYLTYIFYLVKKVILKNEFALLIPIISFIGYGVVEQGFIQYWVNFSMLFGGIFFVLGVEENE
ncbi:MAG: O-antigen polymerase [Leuconostoc mesenteroides]